MKEGEEKPSKVDFFTSNNCVWDYMSSCHLGGSALEQVWRTMYSSWNNRNSCYWHEVVGFLLSFYGNRNSERFRLDLPKVVAVSLSPLNNWLVTITPFKQEPNLQIWDMKTGDYTSTDSEIVFSKCMVGVFFIISSCGPTCSGSVKDVPCSTTEIL